MKILFVDHYDSFAYNVVHLLASQGFEPRVMHSDDPNLTLSAVRAHAALVVGPGPGNPGQTPDLVALIREAAQGGTTVFGVCFGLQAIAAAFGGRVIHAPAPMHGKTSTIVHDGTGLFAGIEGPFTVTRYHSLCVEETSLPADLQVTARSEDGVVQAAAHRRLPVSGVQFHPESVLSEHGAILIRNALKMAPL